MSDETQEQLDYMVARVQSLSAELRTAEQRLALTLDIAVRAERDRDEYREQVHRLTPLTQQMTSSAKLSAASMVTALDRLKELTAVVDAAEAWRKGIDALYEASGLMSYERALYAAVDTYRDQVAKRKASTS